MRVFDIFDASKRNRKPCARLIYDERADEASIIIAPDAAVGDLPLMLALFAERGEREIPDAWARRWVEERVPPRGRQNLGEILRANGLDSYDEIALLAAAEGRSAQDDFLLREVSQPTVEYAFVSLGEGDGGADTESAGAESANVQAARSWCKVIGPEIARKRKAAGMTQRDLAEKTGIDQAAISRIESGRANPTINTLDALVEGVGFSLLVKIV